MLQLIQCRLQLFYPVQHKNQHFHIPGLTPSCLLYTSAWCGQTTQKPLSHSADHSTIDWGYLYLSADGETTLVGDGLQTCCSLSAGGPAAQLIIAYDDICLLYTSAPG